MSDPAEFDPEDGGARKSFWEHVQDLRGALVKSVIALGVALIVCLFLDSRIVALLERPLARMRMFETPKTMVTLQWGEKKLEPFAVTGKDFPGLPDKPGGSYVYRFGTTRIGNEDVVTLHLDPTAQPTTTVEVRLLNLSPAEAFFVAFHVALYAAIVVSSPFWLFFLGGFIVPAFKSNERRAIGAWFGWGVILAIAGILLTYFLLLPVALRASIKYSELLGFSAADWQADQYISFVCKFLLGMGLGFQFPLVVLFMVKLGLVTHQQLAQYRRHVIVVSLVLGAILTTPEVITQVAMAVPLYLLYEICIWIAWYWDWKKRKAAPAA
jgi:sec-independent protein translocase protein TatC